MRTLTMSGLDFAAKCVGPFVLPGQDRDRKEWRDGRRKHEILASVVGASPEISALSDTEKTWLNSVRFKTVVTWLEQTSKADAARSEVAYALNVATGEVRELGAHIGRAYPDLGPEWIYGTTDLVLVGNKGEIETYPPIPVDPQVAILDWKTTSEDVGRFLGNPRDALQLLAYAYCAAWLSTFIPGTGLSQYVDLSRMPPARIAHAYVSGDGQIEIRDARIEPSEWPAVLEQIRAVWSDVNHGKTVYLHEALTEQSGILPVHPGPHCTTCPALISCPATQQAVALLAPVETSPEVAVERLPPATLADALTAGRHLRKVIGLVEERAKLLAAEGLLPGYRLVERERREVQARAAYDTLIVTYGPDVAHAAMSTSASAIRQVLRGAGVKAAEVTWLLEDLAKAGAMPARPYQALVRDGAGEDE